MFSNIVFNTAVITRSFTPYNVTANKVFEQRYGPNAHIEQVEGIFLERLNHFIEAAKKYIKESKTHFSIQVKYLKMAFLPVIKR